MLFIGGLSGMAHQAVLFQAGVGVSELLVFAYMAMLGYPLALRADERRKE